MSTVTAVTTYARSSNGSYLNVPIAAASSRTVFLVFSGKGATFRQITTATLNGVSSAAVIQNGGVDGGQGIGISIAVFTETELPAAGSYTITPTWDGTTNYNTLAVIEVANGPQSAPFIGTVQIDSATAALGQTPLTGTVTDGDGDIVFGVVSAADGSDLTGCTISANSANLGNLVSEVSQTQAVTFVMRDDVAGASENYSMTLDTNSVNIDSVYANYFAIVSPGAGPTVTTPTSGTDGTNVQFTGTDCDTITTSALESGTVVKSLNITAQTTTTVNLDLVSGANGLSLGVPVDGIPLNPTISAAGTTPYTVNLRVSDGVDSNTLGFTLNASATNDVIQTMIATANTNPAESIFGHVGGIENNHQALVPKTVGTTNFTWAADGTFTADSNATVTFDVPLYSPSTENWSLLRVTVSDGAIVAAQNIGRIGIKIGIGI